MTAASDLIFSLSGMRGTIGHTFHPSHALHLGLAYGALLPLSHLRPKVVVGSDTRPSVSMIKAALVAGLTAVGIDVIDIGIVPTPTVQHLIREHHADGGLVITASHNPETYNGIKSLNADGMFIDTPTFNRLHDRFTHPNPCLASWDQIGQVTTLNTAIDTHIDRLFATIDVSTIKQSTLSVCIDTNHGAGALATPRLFDRLGIAYTLIGGNADGQFAHTPEPVEANLSQLKTQMKNGHFDIGFAQDPDADRLVIVDENGRFIGEDYTLAFSVDHILSQHPSPVVVNASTSSLVAAIAKRHQQPTYETAVGEAYVGQGMLAHKAIIGGEGNGGVMYAPAGYGRDSLAGILLVLNYLQHQKKPVSELVDSYPSFYLKKDKLPCPDHARMTAMLSAVQTHYSHLKQTATDGVKLYHETGWVQLRASNTEPIIRLFAESSQSLAHATALINEVKQVAGL